MNTQSTLSAHPYGMGLKELLNGTIPSKIMETFSSKNRAELCPWAGALTLLRLWLRQCFTTEGEGVPGPAWGRKGWGAAQQAAEKGSHKYKPSAANRIIKSREEPYD
ncbi:hypothetical protein XENORESO_011792 [Xenotaenia resolanae]|uniref:Uncharacterized protein n=1 Tax=Xenotaenia resolanae TaxID=208358 RepID=A0ABV0WCT6_9TELE